MSMFAQSVDSTRPHTLLTANPKFSGSLEFRYDDTGETVNVPNIWYNQTFQVRVGAIRWDALQHEQRAEQFEKSPPYNLSKAAAADLARRYRESAARIRSEAARMEQAGDLAYPTLASRLKVEYGSV